MDSSNYSVGDVGEEVCAAPPAVSSDCTICRRTGVLRPAKTSPGSLVKAGELPTSDMQVVGKALPIALRDVTGPPRIAFRAQKQKPSRRMRFRARAALFL